VLKQKDVKTNERKTRGWCIFVKEPLAHSEEDGRVFIGNESCEKYITFKPFSVPLL
jgi:hypothetical protein